MSIKVKQADEIEEILCHKFSRCVKFVGVSTSALRKLLFDCSRVGENRAKWGRECKTEIFYILLT